MKVYKTCITAFALNHVWNVLQLIVITIYRKNKITSYNLPLNEQNIKYHIFLIARY